MKYRVLDGIGKKSSVFVYGTGNSKIMGEDEGLACECLDMAWQAGFTMFDSAHIYGNAERNVGKWMEKRGLREKAVILTKGCNPGMKGSADVMTPELIRNQVEESLDRLRTDCIDLYILHRDQPDMPVEPVVEVLNELKEAGKIKRFGGSNWTVERVKELNEYAAKHQMEGFTAVSPCFNMMDHAEDPWGGSVCINGRRSEKILQGESDSCVCVFFPCKRIFIRKIPHRWQETDGRMYHAGCDTGIQFPGKHRKAEKSRDSCTEKELRCVRDCTCMAAAPERGSVSDCQSIYKRAYERKCKGFFGETYGR